MLDNFRPLLFFATILCVASCDSTSYDQLSVRSVPDLEGLVYADYFNSTLQLELARSYWSQFEKSSRRSETDASQCIGAYLVASVESGDDREIKSEFKHRFEILMAQAGYGGASFETAYNNMKLLYEGTRQTVKLILSLRDDFGALENEMRNSKTITPNAQEVLSAVMRHIKKVYDVETGRQQIVGPSGGSLKFGSGFYDEWTRGLRGYGLVLPKQDDLASTFMIEEVLETPLHSYTVQTGPGASEGLYLLPNGNVIVPGLKHFKSIPLQSR